MATQHNKENNKHFGEETSKNDSAVCAEDAGKMKDNVVRMSSNEENKPTNSNSDINENSVDIKEKELTSTDQQKNSCSFDNTSHEKQQNSICNPYAQSNWKSQTLQEELTDDIANKQAKECAASSTENNKENPDKDEVSSMPAKRKMDSINIMNTLPKKKIMGKKHGQPLRLLVEGYAFHDDIIGVAHRRNDGEEAFNIVLRNMVFNKELEEEGFSAYVALRDKSSGKEDKLLTNDDGYPKFLFMSINAHHFNNINEANKAVIEQCQKLQAVSTKYLPYVVA